MRTRWYASGAVLALVFWAAVGPASPTDNPPPDRPAAPKDGHGGAADAVRKSVPADAITAIENAETFTLYSLDPGRTGPKDAKEKFYDWAVLGRTDVADSAVRKQLVAALWKGVAESDGMVAGCFNPRHGVRVTHKGKTVDFILCFECLSVRVTDGKRRGTFLITRSPQPAFDKALTDLRVPLAPKAGT